MLCQQKKQQTALHTCIHTQGQLHQPCACTYFSPNSTNETKAWLLSVTTSNTTTAELPAINSPWLQSQNRITHILATYVRSWGYRFAMAGQEGGDHIMRSYHNCLDVKKKSWAYRVTNSIIFFLCVCVCVYLLIYWLHVSDKQAGWLGSRVWHIILCKGTFNRGVADHKGILIPLWVHLPSILKQSLRENIYQ